MTFLVHKNERREVRRRVAMPCRVVRERDCRLIGECAVDASPDGMLVVAMTDVALGDEVVVGFEATDFKIRFEAEGIITRIVRGRRMGDRGRCVGIQFRKFDPIKRFILRGHLRRSSPPLPQREPLIDYAATVKRIASS